MKYSTIPIQPMKNPSIMFCEQVSTITSLFENWNECERTVVLYALLKRISFYNLKFLQLCIDYNLQISTTQPELNNLERNANNPSYLRKLVGECNIDVTRNDIEIGSSGSISSLRRTSQTEDGSVTSGFGNPFCTFPRTSVQSDICLEGSNFTKKCDIDTSRIYQKDYMQDNYNDNINSDHFKGSVLPDLLCYLPLLRPGNEEAKAVYMSVVPRAVGLSGCEDLCQQLLSYLLIHPAVNSEDRRSLTQWLRHLEDHISGSQMQINQISCPQNVDSQTAPPVWPPQANNINNTTFNQWNNFHDLENSKDEFRKTIGKNLEFKIGRSENAFDEESHMSFSKNGTEIDDENKSDIQCDGNDNNLDFFTQNFKLYNVSHKTSENLKTRRSHSLTPCTDDNIFKSVDSLNVIQKPRSFSLSSEHSVLLSPHAVLASSGSETRLDDFKQTKDDVKLSGMSNIGQWLKSLRLHKYSWLFSNISYDQMLEITEDHLQTLGVTKGARHKLVLSIQKLKERYSVLCQVERDLMTSQGAALFGALEDLRAVIVSPIKPEDSEDGKGDRDLVLQFIKILEIVSTLINNSIMQSAQDEECVSLFFWLIDKAVASEAFTEHIPQLRALRFRTHRSGGFPATQFSNKSRSYNGGNYGNINNRDINVNQRRNSDFGPGGRNVGKNRWNNRQSSSHQHHHNQQQQKPQQQQQKQQQQQQWTNNNQTTFQKVFNNNNTTKNQNYQSYNGSKQLSALFKQHIHQQFTGNKPQTTELSNNKSSSFPTFTAANSLGANSLLQEPHRHSLTSLMPQQNENVNDKVNKTNEIINGTNLINNNKSCNSSVVEINNRLESLCLQMTEQAIE